MALFKCSASSFCKRVSLRPICLQLHNLIVFQAFAPILLERKAARIRKEMDNDPEKGGPREVRTRYDNADRHWQQIVSKALVRPFKLFYSEPIAQLLGAYMAFVYGLLYRECHMMYAGVLL
jgi:hypothetical protein